MSVDLVAEDTLTPTDHKLAWCRAAVAVPEKGTGVVAEERARVKAALAGVAAPVTAEDAAGTSRSRL